MADHFRLPNLRQRLVVVGRTGSGKTVFGFWALSEARFDRQPFIIVDYKGDDLLNSVPFIKEIGLNELPKHPGLYITHPHPSNEFGVEQLLINVWERENIGMYFDEIYMVPAKQGLQGLLTQGRSKNIPVIALAQRPVWCSRFLFSEADYFAVFHLNHAGDHKKVREFIPSLKGKENIPEYQCHWYDVGKNSLFNLVPVPQPEIIAQRIEDKLKPKRTFF